MYADGGVLLLSDKNAKESIEEVDAKTVLAKLEELPVTKWSYTNTPSVRHIGPMAQDFAASFGYGMVTNDDKHISLGDEVGVSLAAIKGLNQTVKEQNAELQALQEGSGGFEGPGGKPGPGQERQTIGSGSAPVVTSGRHE